jgi:RNase P protein component
VKRRLRELLRAGLLPMLRSRTALDVVVRAAPEAYAATFDALCVDVVRIAHRLEAAA